MCYLWVVLAIFVLGACQPAPPKNVIKDEFREYEIVHIDRPKHFWVNLKDTRTGQVFKREGRRKHCTAWRNWSIGDRIQVRTQYYKNEGDTVTYIRLVSVSSILCDQG